MLCDLSHSFPLFVADFLDRGAKLQKQFREETFTDMMMGALLGMGPWGIIVSYPNEPSTGADMEWAIVSLRRKRIFRIRLQAKRLYSGGGIWSRHSYKELDHQVGTPTLRYQADILIDRSRKDHAVPLYIFYNPGETCRMAADKGVKDLEGVMLASGRDVRNLVIQAASSSKRNTSKSIGSLRHLFFPLRALFCPGGMVWHFQRSRSGTTAFLVDSIGLAGVGEPPSPETVRERLEALLSRSADESDGEVSQEDREELPQVQDGIPEEILAAIDASISGEPGKLPRSDTRRAIFVSEWDRPRPMTSLRETLLRTHPDFPGEQDLQ